MRTFNQIRELVERALSELLGEGDHRWIWIRDLTDDWAAYELEGSGWPKQATFKVTYSIDDEGKVTLGTPEEVLLQTDYVAMAEAVGVHQDRIVGRVLEAKADPDASGGRVFRVQVVAYGDSLNARRYPEAVMRAAAPLYEGAKAYDHHRTVEELASSTIQGLVGTCRNVEAGPTGLEADLHLLPSATHTAEALDASLAAQTTGLAPVVGISHDVMARYQPITDAGRRLMEATEIVAVNSADVVANPAAGGHATRMLAGGLLTPPTPIQESSVTFEEMLALFTGATPEQRAQLAAATAVAPEVEGEVTPVTESTLVPAADAGEPTYPRAGIMGRNLIRTAIADANLDERLAESVAGMLPEKFTESQLQSVLGGFARFAEGMERAGLKPTVPNVAITKDVMDKKAEKLDAMFDGNFREGYRSLKSAYRDISGSGHGLDEAELPFEILRESFAGGRREGERSTESIDSTSWGEILGDSITRRMVKEYSIPSLQTWRKLVSSIVPRNDFRTVRVTRMGGYGVLPAVAQTGVYQPLTSPGDEEATYAITKRGGTEDLTLEAIANDDLGAVRAIPSKLGRAAAQTLYRFVFDLLRTNPNIYDAVALFAAGHNNTDAASPLSQSTLSAGRKKMRTQAAFGDASEILSIVPKLLVVPSALEEVAFQLATSAVAITGNQDATIPNIHQGLEPVVVDYFSDENDWFLVGDPDLCPTIELGFFGGREDPELFVQDDPRAGAAFNADKITWKIRHIYSGAVLDFRAFYRGQVV